MSKFLKFDTYFQSILQYIFEIILILVFSLIILADVFLALVVNNVLGLDFFKLHKFRTISVDFFIRILRKETNGLVIMLIPFLSSTLFQIFGGHRRISKWYRIRRFLKWFRIRRIKVVSNCLISFFIAHLAMNYCCLLFGFRRIWEHATRVPFIRSIFGRRNG